MGFSRPQSPVRIIGSSSSSRSGTAAAFPCFSGVAAVVLCRAVRTPSFLYADHLIGDLPPRRPAAIAAGASADRYLPATTSGVKSSVASRLKRRRSPIRVRHVAEVLAGMADGPAIGEGTDAK